MKTVNLVDSFWLLLLLTLRCEAQTYDTNNDVLQTFAGSAQAGYLDANGTNGVETSEITFESFLKNPPVIAQADFEIEDPPAPPETLDEERMWKQIAGTEAKISPPITNIIYSLKYDGTSYLLYESNLDQYVRQFGQVTWTV